MSYQKNPDQKRNNYDRLDEIRETVHRVDKKLDRELTRLNSSLEYHIQNLEEHRTYTHQKFSEIDEQLKEQSPSALILKLGKIMGLMITIGSGSASLIWYLIQAGVF